MNSFVIADPSLCIGCRTCEVACAVSHQSGSCSGTLEREGGLHLAIEDGHLVSKDSHFQPRLKVIVGSKVTTPVLCRQCEDKPCAMACPNNAIVSEDGCVKVLQARCIGCKSCVVACPYGAMAVVVKEVAPLPIRSSSGTADQGAGARAISASTARRARPVSRCARPRRCGWSRRPTLTP